MVDISDIYTTQLRETCKLAGAAWAIWLLREGSQWVIYPQEAMSKFRRSSLMELIAIPQTTSWLSGSLSSGRARSRNVGDFSSQIGCQQIFIFPNPKARAMIVVGADHLEKADREIFRVLAIAFPVAFRLTDTQLLDGDDSVPPLTFGLESSFELNKVLDLVLSVMVEMVSCEAAYLAIRSGNLFRIESTWGCPPEIHGQDISLTSAGILDEVVETHLGVIRDIREDEPHLKTISQSLLQPLRKVMIVPVLVGPRVIGEVVFASASVSAFSYTDLKRLTQYVSRISHSVENALIFTEASQYLQQLALLNELALAASGGIDTAEVARRVVRRLRLTFNTEQVVVLMLSKDGNTLLEYGGGNEGTPPMVIPVEKSLAGYVVENRKSMRLGDISEAPRFYPSMPEVRSALIVPLLYRGEMIGTICLQSNMSNAFTERDEQLLLVIASHLAGLFENVRLNQETREHAMKLSLIHQVAQRVVGLVDEAEIARETANLMAAYFGYELAVVLLADDSSDHLSAVGVGGSMAHLLPENFKYPISRGITGLVFRNGKGGYFNDVSQEEVYLPLPGWLAGSEMCVPLLDGDRVFGAINVERGQKHTFTQIDLLLLESLAGILSSVILSARQYQELQERIEALREAENRQNKLYAELRSSLERLEKSQKALIQAEKIAAAGRLTASIAHEINNPLQSLSNCLHLVGRIELSADLREKYLVVAQTELERLMLTVQRMLDLYRPGAKERQWIDAKQLVQHVLALLEPQMQENNIEIHNRTADELLEVLVVSSQIQQVILNLLLNSIEAMPHGGKIFIDICRGKEGVEIIIEDTGAGIPEGERERIFEPFTSTKVEGTGLGLSVSYGIIQAHGGTIEIVPDRGLGACFRIVLPTGEKP